MKFVTVFLGVLLSLGMSNAFAAESCYSADQALAEKELRYHTELMVITVTCKQGSDGRDLGHAYTGITRHYINDIKEAEHILEDHYASLYGGSGQEQLDKLRTRLANEYGQIVAKESAPRFCALRRDLVTKLYDSRRMSFETESIRANQHIELSSPTCHTARQEAKNRQKPLLWN